MTGDQKFTFFSSRSPFCCAFEIFFSFFLEKKNKKTRFEYDKVYGAQFIRRSFYLVFSLADYEVKTQTCSREIVLDIWFFGHDRLMMGNEKKICTFYLSVTDETWNMAKNCPQCALKSNITANEMYTSAISQRNTFHLRKLNFTSNHYWDTNWIWIVPYRMRCIPLWEPNTITHKVSGYSMQAQCMRRIDSNIRNWITRCPQQHFIATKDTVRHRQCAAHRMNTRTFR